MKTRLFYLVVFLLLFVYSNASAQSSDNFYKVVDVSSLNVRASATTYSKIIGKLSAGDVVSVEEIKGRWACIKYEDKLAYVSLKYLKKVESTVLPQVVQEEVVDVNEEPKAEEIQSSPNTSIESNVPAPVVEPNNDVEGDPYVMVSALPTFNGRTMMNIASGPYKEHGLSCEIGMNTAFDEGYMFGMYFGITGNVRLMKSENTSLFFTAMVSPLAFNFNKGYTYREYLNKFESTTETYMNCVLNPRLTLKSGKFMVSIGYFLIAQKWNFSDRRTDCASFSIGYIF